MIILLGGIHLPSDEYGDTQNTGVPISLLSCILCPIVSGQMGGGCKRGMGVRGAWADACQEKNATTLIQNIYQNCYKKKYTKYILEKRHIYKWLFSWKNVILDS